MLSSCPHEDFRGCTGHHADLAPRPTLVLGQRLARGFGTEGLRRDAARGQPRAVRAQSAIERRSGEPQDRPYGARRAAPQRIGDGLRERNFLPSRESQYAGSRRAPGTRHRPRAMSARTARRLWAIVPAAGRGERFASSASPSIPKQYTPLLGRSVLEWSLRALLAEPRILGIVVVLAAGDAHWAEIARSLD